MENSFFIEYTYNNSKAQAEIKTCCNEQDVWYYDVLMNDQFQFTITPTFENPQDMKWKISLKNSDKEVDIKLIEVIGHEIEKRMFLTN